MSYITREDGIHFVTPSYRDTLSIKKPSLLKKEILSLSAKYGEYITLQKRNVAQYEVAFSKDPGFLLGETIWNHFNKPDNLIYCEVLQGSTEAILVIVKGGSVYLDSVYSIEAIYEELIVFQTEKLQFQIYIYGDLPISAKPAEGKFSLPKTSVKSFTQLKAPVFPTLETVKMYQLGLAKTVLSQQGIGVFPLKEISIILGAVFIVIILWNQIYYFFKKRAEQLATLPAVESYINPHQFYIQTLQSAPSADQEIQSILQGILKLYTMPGWIPIKISYLNGKLIVSIKSLGIRIKPLMSWAEQAQAELKFLQNGVEVSLPVRLNKRINMPPLQNWQDIFQKVVDRISYIVHGNNIIVLGNAETQGQFYIQSITINLPPTSLSVIQLVANQLKDLPVILSKADFDLDNNGLLMSKIQVRAIGK